MSNFFISRPIFAGVIAIIAMLAGVISLLNMPLEQYPDIAPPSISLSAAYPGASAKAMEDAVTQVIEQQMKGIDNLSYISASSNANGTMAMTLTFESGTDPDIAQVQVQNKLALATPLLPQEVQRQGVTVNKARSGFLLAVALIDSSGTLTEPDIADYLASNWRDPVSRVPGVGQTMLFGSQYALRIWIDPFQLANYGLSTQEVVTAIRAQNTQVTGGEIGGGPHMSGQQLNATITVQSLMQTPEEFAAIALRTLEDGSQVRLGDVARIEIGSESYNRITEYRGIPASGMAIQLAPGANALRTADAVKARIDELTAFLPPNLSIVYPVDSTPFIRESIKEVVKTLIEAAIFVSIIMFLFLQNLRATSIVMITVPVVLLGTFTILLAAGFSINTLTMLAMVLAIGLLVDDAIVVIENVDRVMDEEGLPPREATRKAMSQITGAIMGIGAVLSAVFVPMAFFGGTAGVIYRQFSITIVTAMALSVLTAVILTPALCATILKPRDSSNEPKPGSLAHRLATPLRLFNSVFNAGARRHLSGARAVISRSSRFFIIFLVLSGATGFFFSRLPTSFLPNEDQARMMVQVQLPAGATYDRTLAVLDQIKAHLRHEEEEYDTISGYFTIAGFNFASSGQNTGIAFVPLKDWEERKRKDQSQDAVIQRAMAAFSQIRDAQVFAFGPPSVPGLGEAGGFNFYIQDRSGQGREALVNARNQMLGMASQEPTLVGVRPNGLSEEPQLKVDIDQRRAQAMGLELSTINSTLAAAMGGVYVNDFIDRERVKRVYLAADGPYRSSPEDLKLWRIPNAQGELVPFAAFADISWTTGAPKLERYNGVSSTQIQGSAAPGVSSGEAMMTIEKLAGQLPSGFGIEWTGVSREEIESGSKTTLLYALSLLVVFLCLAALYESWSIPMSVLLIVPLGVMGATLAALMRSLPNDIFFQVGLLTTVGLSAKNAILIVEFASQLEKQGRSAVESAIEAARVRLRPILMTSFAFGLGVTPLVLSSGAGAEGRNAIGAAVLGGMLTAAFLGLFFTPLFYVLVRRLFGSRAAAAPAEAMKPQPGAAE
ncbi:efflux RND transporter permease subunit [Hyphococcus luteus]|uniref:Efflux pump membrane transporter n=1 Tax=Hyphococcus luteus TaxID=2058213 RepID=A0A2S7K3E5_9PROT|nr:efflux RND transporter permease subunit [Marinicaulis flavus]PQA87011.1 hydrophobe/amphiphile efflux-1 family RND transporter [Marinicaulis flavus]